MISSNYYEKIIDLIPICCVDVIIVSDDKYLLIKRRKNPEKNKWWVPGGRIFKGERIKTCALRKAKEEAGLKCSFVKILGIYETFFDKGIYGKPLHTINVMCLLKKKGNNNIELDNNHSDYCWKYKIDQSLNHDIINFLKKSGFS